MPVVKGCANTPPQDSKKQKKEEKKEDKEK